MVNTLFSEVQNEAYYWGGGAYFSVFVSNVTTAESYPSIPNTGLNAYYAGTFWDEAIGELSTIVSDEQLCFEGDGGACYLGSLVTSSEENLSNVMGNLQEAVQLGE